MKTKCDVAVTRARLAKPAYYVQGGMKSGLARRYWRHFSGARFVLDVGCGIGEFGRYRPPGVEVHGVDGDPGAVKRACEFEKAICLDLDDGFLPYGDGTFGGVLAKDVFEHLHRPEEVVREIYRVLQPNGLLIASVVVANPRRVWADYTHVRGFTPQAARLLLEDAGFLVEALWAMGGVPLSNRLGLMNLVPLILRLPVAAQLWRSSWELRARKVVP